jgi:hypothetical protein
MAFMLLSPQQKGEKMGNATAPARRDTAGGKEAVRARQIAVPSDALRCAHGDPRRTDGCGHHSRG